MLTSEQLADTLIEHGYQFITGVPDSVFKDFLITVNQDERFSHVITSNEGESCALATGYHLATGSIPVVYCQNSGFGNALNPLTSLMDEKVYAIPALLMIGWRAAPGEHDEPQHLRMGEIQEALLQLMNIPYVLVESDASSLSAAMEAAAEHFATEQHPFALLFKRKAIQPASPKGIDAANANVDSDFDLMVREVILNHLIKALPDDAVLVTTTGKTSRELFEIREQLGQTHEKDFLTVGSMGCASTIALGIAIASPDGRPVVVIDGDGAALMRLEAMPTIGAQKPPHFLHIIVDNQSYESTGSQKTLSESVDFCQIAMACGYVFAQSISTEAEIHDAVSAALKHGPSCLVIQSKPFSRADLGRPTTTPVQNKTALMQTLGAIPCKPSS